MNDPKPQQNGFTARFQLGNWFMVLICMPFVCGCLFAPVYFLFSIPFVMLFDKVLEIELKTAQNTSLIIGAFLTSFVVVRVLRYLQVYLIQERSLTMSTLYWDVFFQYAFLIKAFIPFHCTVPKIPLLLSPYIGIGLKFHYSLVMRPVSLQKDYLSAALWPYLKTIKMGSLNMTMNVSNNKNTSTSPLTSIVHRKQQPSTIKVKIS